MNIQKRTVKIPARVGMMSLIGVGRDRPAKWGNYFGFASCDEFPGWGVRCLNFWAENLDSARERFLSDGLVQVTSWSWDENFRGKMERGEFAIVDDERIPEDWYYNKMCYTGYGKPPLEVMQQVFEHIGGDPHNCLEEFTDPASYWAKRGGVYHDNGVISFNVGEKSKKLDVKYECKIEDVTTQMSGDTISVITKTLIEATTPAPEAPKGSISLLDAGGFYCPYVPKNL